MKIEIDPNGIWYHGSNKQFDVLQEGSTITQWRELAEAFSHQPNMLGYRNWFKFRLEAYCKAVPHRFVCRNYGYVT